jgi:hypothetical protein
LNKVRSTCHWMYLWFFIEVNLSNQALRDCIKPEREFFKLSFVKTENYYISSYEYYTTTNVLI